MAHGLTCTRVSLVAQLVRHLPAMQETRVQSPGQEDPLEKETATHSSILFFFFFSSILAWRIPRTEELGRLQSHGITESDTTARSSLSLFMWDLPRPGINPVSPALQGAFLTTGPPAKHLYCVFKETIHLSPFNHQTSTE